MELCNLPQNLDVNWVPLSDTIFLGTPCKHTILVMYNSASFGPWYVSLTGMKWATLVRRSTITHMESYPDWVRGNPTINPCRFLPTSTPVSARAEVTLL